MKLMNKTLPCLITGKCEALKKSYTLRLKERERKVLTSKKRPIIGFLFWETREERFYILIKYSVPGTVLVQF